MSVILSSDVHFMSFFAGNDPSRCDIAVCGRIICTWCRPVGTWMAISCLYWQIWCRSGGVIWSPYSKEDYRFVSVVSADVHNLNLVFCLIVFITFEFCNLTEAEIADIKLYKPVFEPLQLCTLLYMLHTLLPTALVQLVMQLPPFVCPSVHCFPSIFWNRLTMDPEFFHVSRSWP